MNHNNLVAQEKKNTGLVSVLSELPKVEISGEIQISANKSSSNDNISMYKKLLNAKDLRLRKEVELNNALLRTKQKNEKALAEQKKQTEETIRKNNRIAEKNKDLKAKLLENEELLKLINSSYNIDKADKEIARQSLQLEIDCLNSELNKVNSQFDAEKTSHSTDNELNSQKIKELRTTQITLIRERFESSAELTAQRRQREIRLDYLPNVAILDFCNTSNTESKLITRIDFKSSVPSDSVDIFKCKLEFTDEQGVKHDLFSDKTIDSDLKNKELTFQLPIDWLKLKNIDFDSKNSFFKFTIYFEDNEKSVRIWERKFSLFRRKSLEGCSNQ